MASSGSSSLKSGFTLIELSIVLVIIGLIVGGILTGQDLIDAAAQRAQVTQIERYNTAVNTFRLKYDNLPGDMPYTVAGQFGLFNQGNTAGFAGQIGGGDANGLIQEWSWVQSPLQTGPYGEPRVFWRHLSDANLVDGTFGADLILYGTVAANQTPSQIPSELPTAKINATGFILPYSDGSYNYFEIRDFTQLGTGEFNYDSVNGAITPLQAYNMDKKMDDGLPLSGTVQATQNGNGWIGRPSTAGDGCTAASGSAYDIATTNANKLNCELSFRFQ